MIDGVVALMVTLPMPIRDAPKKRGAAMTTDLLHKHSQATASRLTDAAVADLLKQIPAWTIDRSGDGALRREFTFKNYYEVMAFVNAVAWISHHQDHHPDMQVGYNRVTISYITHSAGGLTENDFICAAKVSTLLNETP
jgi:4a-hydroxytetrahydrobiopterin dehydratase